MDAFARQYVWQGYTRSQNFHPHFTTLRFGTLLFDDLKFVGSAVLGDDDSCVFHKP